jgi:hypothetical protein
MFCCLCSTVTFVTHTAGNKTVAGGNNVHTATQQQRSCVIIRAVLSPLQAASKEQALSIKSSLQQGAAAFNICSAKHTAKPKKTAASEPASHVREVLLLVPLQEANTTTAGTAATHSTSTSAQNSSSNSAAPAAASQPLLLMLYAEQQLGQDTYVWTASQLLMPGKPSSALNF